jgi:hypothetical protein
MDKRKPVFISIGTCEVCQAAGMELFHSKEGLACVTCKEIVDVRTPLQNKTVKDFEKNMQYLRNRLENHGGH